METTFLILTLSLIFFEAFGLGMMLYNIADLHMYYKLNKGLNKTELADKFHEMIKSNVSSMIVMALCIIGTVIIFIGGLNAYTNKKLYDYKNGDIQCEEIVKTRNRPNEAPQVDTTYRFYKVKK